MVNHKRDILVLGFITLVVIAIVLSMPAIPQSKIYHSFADQRAVWGIPHFYNVLSNIPFLVVAVWGYFWHRSGRLHCLASHQLSYRLFFIAVGLVCFGSIYYHVEPNNETLVWDRIPITVAFMSLFSIIIAEFISERFALKIRMILILAGILSVLFWITTESLGDGDLRFYILVQLIPLILIPIILLRFIGTFSSVKSYWFLLAAYSVAKLAEVYDKPIYEFLGFISGHTLKHLIVAVGIVFLIIGFHLRRQV